MMIIPNYHLILTLTIALIAFSNFVSLAHFSVVILLHVFAIQQSLKLIPNVANLSMNTIFFYTIFHHSSILLFSFINSLSLSCNYFIQFPLSFLLSTVHFFDILVISSPARPPSPFLCRRPRVLPPPSSPARGRVWRVEKRLKLMDQQINPQRRRLLLVSISVR